jgi:hypothetical protein
MGFVGSILLMVTFVALAGTADRDVVIMLGCMVYPLMLSALVGLPLGITAFKKGTHNPGWMWLGPVLNGITGAFWVVCMILGNMRR